MPGHGANLTTPQSTAFVCQRAPAAFSFRTNGLCASLRQRTGGACCGFKELRRLARRTAAKSRAGEDQDRTYEMSSNRLCRIAANPGKPTVLIYGHYDVQPVDPLREWRWPLFNRWCVARTSMEGEHQTTRGNCSRMKALECYLRAAGKLPLNVRCLFEGEEEIGSPACCLFLSTIEMRSPPI